MFNDEERRGRRFSQTKGNIDKLRKKESSSFEHEAVTLTEDKLRRGKGVVFNLGRRR